MLQTSRSKLIKQDGVPCCPICGCSQLRRIPRTSFAQKKILPKLGYYPWECGECKEPFLLRRRFGKNGSHDLRFVD